ncbi:MAG: hypothetical protein ACRDWW_07440 [Acidimicrobiales bacterium]
MAALKRAYAGLLARYSGAAQKQEQFLAGRTEAGAAVDHVMQLGGGVSRIRITSVTVLGPSAHIAATVEDWAAGADHQPTGIWAIAIPSGEAEYDLDLNLTSGGSWVVTAMPWKFAPGQGP